MTKNQKGFANIVETLLSSVQSAWILVSEIGQFYPDLAKKVRILKQLFFFYIYQVEHVLLYQAVSEFESSSSYVFFASLTDEKIFQQKITKITLQYI